MQEFKFDHQYRKSDEYYQFCQCLKSLGVDEMMWDYCIMVHKSNPTLYKTEKKKKTNEEPVVSKQEYKIYNNVEILPPSAIEEIVVES